MVKKFSLELKRMRKERGISWQDVEREIGIKQSLLAYIENREPHSFDLYLQFLVSQGIDISNIFKHAKDKVSVELKFARKKKDISWHVLSKEIGITQAPLSYLENKKNGNFINYLRYLACKGIDLNSIYR